MLTFAIIATGQTKIKNNNFVNSYAEQELKSALSDESEQNLIDNKTVILKSRLSAIKFVEPILFSIYGYKNIIQQKPYEICFLNNYWVIFGKLPKNNLGGTFLIIINSLNCEIIKITHGK